MTFDSGVWRPTESSIMQYLEGEFNAPSREAIFKNIMLLSGDTYSFDKFVEYDSKNISTTSMQSQSQAIKVNVKTFVPLPSPVFVK